MVHLFTGREVGLDEHSCGKSGYESEIGFPVLTDRLQPGYSPMERRVHIEGQAHHPSGGVVPNSEEVQ